MKNKSSLFYLNFIFFLLIGVVFFYSYFFYPNNQPIECAYKQLTGNNCNSCGFSRAFSAFTHLKITEGELYNAYAFNCFLFIISQFTVRGFYTFYLYSNKKINTYFLVIETTLTILFFLFAFFPLLQ